MHTFQAEVWLLDPKTWQAVGKTRGWDNKFRAFFHLEENTTVRVFEIDEMAEWGYKQHIFIDALADGKTIEEALEEIS